MNAPLSLPWTLFENLKDISGQLHSLSWPDLASILSQHDRRPVKGGPLFLPGALLPGTTRAARNVAELSAVVLDLDQVTPDQLAQALEALLPWQYVYYSTHSTTAEHPKGRFVLPLARSLPPDRYRRLWTHLGECIGGIQDAQTKDPSRIYYWPTCPSDAEPLALINDAAPILDPDTLALPEPTHADTLQQMLVLKAVRTLKRSSPAEWAARWDQVLTGQPFGVEGDRHNTLLRLTYDLARQLPHASPEILLSTFTRSLQRMADVPGAPTIEQALEMLLSAQAKLQQMDHEILAPKINYARQDGIVQPYSPDELLTIAEKQHCTPEELAQRWILYAGGSYYLLTLGTGYVGPYLTDISCVAETILSPAPIRTTRRTVQGDLKVLLLDDLLRQYGTPFNTIIADLTADVSWFDPATRTLHEATARCSRHFEPVNHPEIQKWLTVLGGLYADKLLDWISVLPQVDKPIAGLYLFGSSGTGKSLLAHGASQLWGDGVPTDIAEATATFNERLARNPLILADEFIPQKYGESTTGLIRQLIGAQAFTIRRKHKTTCELHGALRVIFASNEPDLFSFEEVVGRLGQEALAKRILYIPVASKAADVLTSIKPETLQFWRTQYIAEHILYLSTTRRVIPGRRLYIEGDLGVMLRRLNVGNRSTSLVCEWLVSYLLDPGKVDLQERGLIKADLGRLYVNNQVLVKHWHAYHENERPLSTHRIGKALGALSKTETSSHLQADVPGRGLTRLRFWEIDTEYLIEWSEANNWATGEELKKRLSERHDGAIPENEAF